MFQAFAEVAALALGGKKPSVDETPASKEQALAQFNSVMGLGRR